MSSMGYLLYEERNTREICKYSTTNFLVTKYEAWYSMFPLGFINPPGRNKGAEGKPGANLRKIKCFNCNNFGHKALDCMEAKKPNDGGARKASPGKAPGGKSSGCFICGQE